MPERVIACSFAERRILPAETATRFPENTRTPARRGDQRLRAQEAATDLLLRPPGPRACHCINVCLSAPPGEAAPDPGRAVRPVLAGADDLDLRNAPRCRGRSYDRRGPSGSHRGGADEHGRGGWRGDRQGSSAGNAGLGLTISRAFVEAQGGMIWAENRAEGGVRFSFTLNRAASGRHKAAKGHHCWAECGPT